MIEQTAQMNLFDRKIHNKNVTQTNFIQPVLSIKYVLTTYRYFQGTKKTQIRAISLYVGTVFHGDFADAYKRYAISALYCGRHASITRHEYAKKRTEVYSKPYTEVDSLCSYYDCTLCFTVSPYKYKKKRTAFLPETADIYYMLAHSSSKLIPIVMLIYKSLFSLRLRRKGDYTI